MIDKVLLERLMVPDYPAVINGFSAYLIMPDEKRFRFFGGNRPNIDPVAFNRYDGKTVLCRIKDCNNIPKARNWATCGLEHSDLFWKEFRKYWWSALRHDIFVRDKYTCVLCHNQLIERRDLLECDHIIPVHFIQLRYPEMSFTERVHRFLYNPENLRCLCRTCHKRVTKEFAFVRRTENMDVLLDKVKSLDGFL